MLDIKDDNFVISTTSREKLDGEESWGMIKLFLLSNFIIVVSALDLVPLIQEKQIFRQIGF